MSNTIAVAVYDKDQPPVTAEPRPWAIDPTVQGASGWFSQPQTLSFPLPAPAAGGEALFDVLSDHFTTTFGANGAFLVDAGRVDAGRRVEWYWIAFRCQPYPLCKGFRTSLP